MRRLFLIALTLCLLATAGCAGAYHAYSCSPPGCGYCPPAPLPYRPADPCLCRDSIGQAYASSPNAGPSAAW